MEQRDIDDAAGVLAALIEAIERGELDASARVREQLRGAVFALGLTATGPLR
jgi:hypothetical protein